MRAQRGSAWLGAGRPMATGMTHRHSVPAGSAVRIRATSSPAWRHCTQPTTRSGPLPPRRGERHHPRQQSIATRVSRASVSAVSPTGSNTGGRSTTGAVTNSAPPQRFTVASTEDYLTRCSGGVPTTCRTGRSKRSPPTSVPPPTHRTTRRVDLPSDRQRATTSPACDDVP